MSKPFIDANLFLRFLVKDPVNPKLNEQAKEIFTRIEAGGLAVQTYLLIVAEVIYVLESYYEKSKEELRELVEPLILLEGIDCPEKEITISALLLSARENVDFTDAYTYLKMQEQGISEIYTFDAKHFRRLGVKTLPL